jgi:glycerophosphoryl diester phosphodiesterase
MPAEFIKRNIEKLQVLRQGGDLFRRNWLPMVAYALIISVAGLLLVTPLSAWILNRLAARSGEFIVGNHELVGWLLSPTGLLYLLLVASVALMGLVLQVVGLIWIAESAGKKGFLSTREILLRAIVAIPNLFRFCLAVFVVCVICLLPLAMGLGAIYLLLLSAHDINYYLTVQPASWQWAQVAGGFWILLWACPAGYLLLRWIYALPIWLDGYRPLRRVFRKSWEVTRGSFSTLFRVIGACLLIWFLVQLVLEGGLFTVTSFLVSRLGGSVRLLLFVISMYLVLAFLINVVTYFLGIAWTTSVLVLCYREQRPSEDSPSTIQTASEPTEKKIAPPHSLLRLRFILPALAVLLAASGAVSVWQLRHKPPDIVPFVIAHRAGALYAPENTLAALELAIRQEADYAEIDVQRSLDGVVVVVHDADLMKVARDPRRIAQTEYAELAKVDIGKMFHSDFTGERVAKLSDFLKNAKGRIKLMIELKYYGKDPELTRETLRLVRESHMDQEVAVISLNLDALRQAQHLAPNVPMGYLSSVSVGNLARLDVDFLAVSGSTATSSLIRHAQKRDQSVYAWTINDVDGMIGLIVLGIDGLITDDPALANEVINQVQTLLPFERLLLRFRHSLDIFDEERIEISQ